jgi:uncharacterized protein (DUF58 family)
VTQRLLQEKCSKPDPKKSAWAERLSERLRIPRRLRVTREGKYYVGITLGVGFAAINTGNNLLYLLLGLLLALIVISGVLSEMSLRHLRITRRLPRRAQVERPHIVEIEVYNEKRRAPSYAIEVEDLRAAQAADKRCFYLKVSPQSAQVAAYRRTPARRGLDHHVGFRVATRFPFGLFEKSREIIAADALITYPAVDAVRLRVDGNARGPGSDGAQARGHGDEIIGIRPMREGDDPRDIYWRRSAHVDQMVLKERARETRNCVDLFLDDTANCEPVTPEVIDQFERRIRDIASRSVAHVRRGDTVNIRTATGQRLTTTPSSGADSLLTFLALIQLSTAAAANQRHSLQPTVAATSARTIPARRNPDQRGLP